MLNTASDVIRALVRYRDIFDPRTGSLLSPNGKGSNFGRDPFRGGFIAGIEERAELLRRLALLEPRERHLLCYWYMVQLPVTQIAKRLHISRVHCYRLKGRALDKMVPPPAEEPQQLQEPQVREPHHITRAG